MLIAVLLATATAIAIGLYSAHSAALDARDRDEGERA